jgi:ribonuclease J
LGQVLTISEQGAKFSGVVPAGRVLIDGLGVGDVGSVVLHDRKLLAEDGLIVVVVTLDSKDGAVSAGPDIVSRGFIYVKESEDIMEEMKSITKNALKLCFEQHLTDWSDIKSAIKAALSSYLYKKIKRSPMILPVIMEI